MKINEQEKEALTGLHVVTGNDKKLGNKENANSGKKYTKNFLCGTCKVFR